MLALTMTASDIDGSPSWFWLIAGANGVGKTTYAMRHLRAVIGSIHFVNLDEIARGLSPLEPRAADRSAARVALMRARELIRERRTFAMETTLAGRSHLGLVGEAEARGLRFGLLYFALPSVELCLERIRRRVTEGGHDVPETDVRRRFARSFANLESYRARAAEWRIFDNRTARPRAIADGAYRETRFRDAEAVAAFQGLIKI